MILQVNQRTEILNHNFKTQLVWEYIVLEAFSSPTVYPRKQSELLWLKQLMSCTTKKGIKCGRSQIILSRTGGKCYVTYNFYTVYHIMFTSYIAHLLGDFKALYILWPYMLLYIWNTWCILVQLYIWTHGIFWYRCTLNTWCIWYSCTSEHIVYFGTAVHWNTWRILPGTAERWNT